MIDLSALLPKIVRIALDAGREIMEVYGTEFDVEYKDDRSPLTLADQRSHLLIEARLRALAPDVPLLSEEGKSIPYSARAQWARFFLVDPLDGTKEFVNRNGEFTVNIALIEAGLPALGVITVPAKDTAYFAASGLGAFKQIGDGAATRIHVRDARPDGSIVAVASRSHGSPQTEEFLRGFDVRERISAGSALKFCLVAEGTADIYPRLAPTWEWDTGAGHAIMLEAGGCVTDPSGSAELAYNKEGLKHSGFVARRAQ